MTIFEPGFDVKFIDFYEKKELWSCTAVCLLLRSYY